MIPAYRDRGSNLVIGLSGDGCASTKRAITTHLCKASIPAKNVGCGFCDASYLPDISGDVDSAPTVEGGLSADVMTGEPRESDDGDRQSSELNSFSEPPIESLRLRQEYL